MKARPVIILAIVVAALIGGVIWFLQRQPTDLATATPAPAATPKVAAKAASPAPGTRPTTANRNAPTPPMTVSPTPAPAAAPPKPIAEWETRIDNVLGMENVPEVQVAQNLINMMPTLPPDGQEQAAQHISNLITDPDYNRVLPLVRNPALPEQVHDVLFTDLMNREDTVKLPTLLEIAKIPTHPYHEEALTDLGIFLDQDNEQNWGKWDTAVKEYLRKQAAAEAADSPAPAPAQ